MGLRINTNVQALLGQHKLQQTSKRLTSALERLSTGLRINSGKDDVVGLLKSESLRTQIRGIAATETNLSNIQSLLGVAEGSLAQLTEVAQAMREKTLLAADASASANDRTNLATAVTDLRNEFSRLVQASEFDGTKLLNGTFTSKTFQIGPNTPDVLSFSITDTTAGVIGQAAVLTSAAFTTSITTASAAGNFDYQDVSSFTITSGSTTTSVGAKTSDGVSNSDSDESAIAYVNAINAASTGVTASVNANVVTFTIASGSTTEITSAETLKINGVSIASSAYSANTAGIANLVAAINAVSAQTGVTATSGALVSQSFYLTAADGRNIDITIQMSGVGTYGSTTTTSNILGMFSALTLTAASDQAYFGFSQRGTFRLVSDQAFTYSYTAGSSLNLLGTAGISVSATTTLSSSFALSQLDVSTSSLASTGVLILDNVIRQLQKRRADIGSKSNRLDAALAELQSRDENLQSAESKIRDTDIAAETAKLTQAQILQQAGVSVLTRANGLPQLALALLQNQ